MEQLIYYGTFEVDNEKMQEQFKRIQNALDEIFDATHELRNMNCIKFKKDPAALSSRDAD